MGKFLASGVDIWVGGYELEGYTLEADAGEFVQDIDDTVMNETAESVMAGIKRGEFNWRGFFDDAAAGTDVALNALKNTTHSIGMPLSTTRGVRAAAGEFANLAYKVTGQLKDLILAKLIAKADGGMDLKGVLLSPKRTDTSNTNDTSLNNAAGSAGMNGYLFVFANNGTATVTIEESSDNGSGDAFATILTFAQSSSGRSTQKVSVSGSIEQYLRSVLTLGTATSVTWAVIVARG